MQIVQETEQGYKVVNTVTGEVTGLAQHYVTNTLETSVVDAKTRKAKECPYLRWESKCRADTVALQEAVKACTLTTTPETSANVCMDSVEPETTEIQPSATGAKRGPKPKVKQNPLHAYMTIIYEGDYDWFDDICYGAMNVKECGRSKTGEYNCSFHLMNRALFLPVISTEIIRQFVSLKTGGPVSQRTSEYVAAAARTALGGIEHFLIRNPDVWAEIKEVYEIEQDLMYTAPTQH